MRKKLRLIITVCSLLLANPANSCGFHFGSFDHQAVQITAHDEQPLWVEFPPMLPAGVNQTITLPIRYTRNAEQAIKVTDLTLVAESSSITNGRIDYALEGETGEVEVPLKIARPGFQLVTFKLSGVLNYPEGKAEPFELKSHTTILAY